MMMSVTYSWSDASKDSLTLLHSNVEETAPCLRKPIPKAESCHKESHQKLDEMDAIKGKSIPME